MASNQLTLGFGKENDIVETPKDLLEIINKEFNFNFDPCPLNPTFDGLEVEWKERNFVNPPYSKIPQFLDKGFKEFQNNKLSVFLITARTATKYWFDYIYPFATEIRFLRNTVAFEGYKTNFPIPLALVIFDPDSSQPIPERTTHKVGKYEYVKM